MTKIIEAGGELVEERAAHNLRKLIAEGSGDEDEDEVDEQIRKNGVSIMLALFDKPVLPDVLQRIMAWVIGEYVHTHSHTITHTHAPCSPPKAHCGVLYVQSLSCC
jgi:hypothetical protein